MTTYQLDPIGQYILVKKVKPEEYITKKGLILPAGDKHGRDGSEGIVEAVGSGRSYVDGGWINFEVEEGDRILFDDRVGTRLVLNGIDYVIITENEVLGKLHKAKE